MSEAKSVVVLGATGNVGTVLTQILATQGHHVRAFYAPGSEDNVAFEAGVQAIPGSFDDGTLLAAAMDGADSVFMLTPPSPSQPEWHQKIVDAARASHVGRIVKLSAFDSGKRSVLQMGRWHHQGEQLVRESGLKYVILRPQYFMQMMRQPLMVASRTGLFSGAAAGSMRMGFVDVRDIAAVAAVALGTSEFDGRTLVPTGPSAPSYEEIADRLAALCGRPVTYVQRTEAEVRETMTLRGWPEWHTSDFLRIHGEAASDLVTGDVSAVTGNQPLSIENFVQEILGPPLRKGNS